MSWTTAADVIAATCFLLGAGLALVAAIGVLRLPDLLSRMHAATKPQVLGLLLVLAGLGFRLRDPSSIGILLLIALFALVTSPVANHMVGRASFRAGQVDRDRLIVDELSEVLPTIKEPRGAP
ncbi:monovalent cation/H(+) antiporter subunit G [Nocardioides sp. JQ2195]|uniref:monovalent cation/H(+) antiporter subunit G n=1 Tax=Nocardioides sp. JQ2195 TaxID=2592334 RepID=UPI00143E5C73|nr:monovalent cation/H(+) antiporter subunit G [Nocardioides sp. JQ2195]QIX25328.1 monovalent cation/H(+) antiporter subunit G [Nocardioides sp. JQ2195]